MGFLKLNFDGSCVQETGLASYGGLILNGFGGTVLSFAGPLHNGSVLDAVLYSLWRGVLALEELGAHGIILGGVSNIVVNWAVGFPYPWCFFFHDRRRPGVLADLCPWCYLDKVDRIRHSMALTDIQCVSWAPLLANSEADELAH